ncbi:hypothetical protein D4740_02785 [Actinomyces sp. 2119]|nr:MULTISPECIES: hypothetical protein [Actinomyces]RJF43895.1 hypothetical protein D4740_02785 [Actinomyces sp. 2119]
MSLSITLVPLALAAVTVGQAWQEGSTPSHPRRTVGVRSRMRDEGLLVDALHDLGVSVQRTEEGRLAGATSVGPLVLTRDSDGLWTIHFADPDSPDLARNFVEDLDRAYGLRVQQAVVQRLRDRAPAAGMRIESETVDDDRVVTLMMEVGAR